jgi:hypothetical protein
MSQDLIRELDGAYCSSVPTFDSGRPYRTIARINTLWEIQTQNLLNANKYITVFLLTTKHQHCNSHYPQLFRGLPTSTQMCTFSAIRTELYYKKRDNMHEDTTGIWLCSSISQASGLNIS